MHIHSPHPLHTYVNSTSRDYTTLCQQLPFLPKPLPLEKTLSGKILMFQQMLLFKDKKNMKSLNFKTKTPILSSSKSKEKEGPYCISGK